MSTDSRLVDVARLFGELLLRELDVATLERLREPATAQAFASLGVELPEPSELDRVAAEYCDAFLQPQHHPPPIESLWIDGSYEGDTTLAVRALSEAAGLELDRDAARGAPPDHAGSLLLLWAATQEMAPPIAERLVADHFEWIERAMLRVTQLGGFYGQVGGAVGELVKELRSH